MDIPLAFFDGPAGTEFASGKTLAEFLRRRLGQDFPGWFNANIANHDEWRNREIPPGGTRHFALLWESFLAQRPSSLLEVLAYTCVFINETGGSFLPRSEGFGNANRPGISYLFDNFSITDSSGHSFQKASYNTGRANRTAGSLFRDPVFNAAHKGKALSEKLSGTADPVWDGEDFPDEVFPTAGKPEQTGYILEADFFKFRGRGLIQTTWRANYAKLVEFVQGYTGKQPMLLRFQSAWADRAVDEICTSSSNEDWDTLFQQSDLAMPCAAVLLHANSGKYLPLALDAATANGLGAGSVAKMGQRISGSLDYGRLLRARIARIVEAMG